MVASSPGFRVTCVCLTDLVLAPVVWCVWPCLLFVVKLVTQEQIDAARASLSAKAAGDAEAVFEAEKARVGDARRAELEAQLAAAAEAAAAAAADAEVR